MRALAACVAATCLAMVGCAEAPELRGAVLIVLDTLRADRLSAYGHERETSPNLDRLAREGVLFENAFSSSSWTLPAVVGLLSARQPTAGVFDGTLRHSQVEALRDAGLRTAAMTEGGYVSRFYGLDRGFDQFREVEGPVRNTVLARAFANLKRGGIEETFAAAREWLEQHADERFFLLVHSYEVHAPYRRREYSEGLERGSLGPSFEIPDAQRVRDRELPIGDVERRYVGALYDGGVREADRRVGELLDTIDRLGLRDTTLVVVTSDHGEDLGERHPQLTGDHGYTLYDEVLRVPLIMRDPGVREPGLRVATQVRLLDVLPTVLERLDVAPRSAVAGRSLVGLMHGETEVDRPALSRLVPADGRSGRTSLRTGTHKLIVNSPSAVPRAPLFELYALSDDPGEHENRSQRDPERLAALRGELARVMAPLREAGDPDFSQVDSVPEALRERLESLGYLER